jgi:hypothetical protein
MNKLLKRIEKLETLTERLEQAVVEIRNSCDCVRFPEPEDDGRFNCFPECERCGRADCICDDLPEEPEGCNCEDGCPECYRFEEEPIEEDTDLEDKEND